jgi:transposase
MVAGGRWLQPRAGEKGGAATGPSPVDRARNGSKHHLLVDATGIPLAWALTGGNRNDVTQLIPLVERVPPVRGKVGRPRRRPERLTADRGYDHDKYRRQLRQRGIRVEIARRQTEHGSGLGRYRWVVERTFAWLHQLKRLLVRYDRRADIHEGFLALGCCLVCYRRLRNSSLWKEL